MLKRTYFISYTYMNMDGKTCMGDRMLELKSFFKPTVMVVACKAIEIIEKNVNFQTIALTSISRIS